MRKLLRELRNTARGHGRVVKSPPPASPRYSPRNQHLPRHRVSQSPLDRNRPFPVGPIWMEPLLVEGEVPVTQMLLRRRRLVERDEEQIELLAVCEFDPSVIVAKIPLPSTMIEGRAQLDAEIPCMQRQRDLGARACGGVSTAFSSRKIGTRPAISSRSNPCSAHIASARVPAPISFP